MSKLDAFIEDVDAKFEMVFEMFDMVLAELSKKADRDEMNQRFDVIEAVVKDYSKQLSRLEHRRERFETT